MVDSKVVDFLGTPAFEKTMEHKDIFLYAAEREKLSYEFYNTFAELQPEGVLRELLRALANEELAHKEKVEYLYCNAAFPQTAGG